jgi:ABC-type Zn uptake system ZnuABC Zn-binding protein ZnuA
MNNRILFLALAAWLGATATASAKLNVVASLPDFAAIAREIGGDQVKVTSLARGTEDAHFVDARPSFIRVLNKADLLIEGGAELEIGWLPPLVLNARNSRILPGRSGYMDASRGITLLEVPRRLDRSQGDVHSLGNPHYWLDPLNGKIMATQLAQVLSRIDPDHADLYKNNLKTFLQRLDQKMAAWTKQMAPFRGVKILTYHKTFEYFAQRFGLEIVGQLEPKPGIEPSPSHIAQLIPRAKQAGVKLVVIEPFRPRRTPAYVAESIGATLVFVPDKVEGHREIKDYFDLFDFDLARIAAALNDLK